MSLRDRLRPVRRLASPVESWEVRRFGRSVLSTLSRVQVLVLESTGRHTGKRRRTPLAYAVLDDAWYVVGGAGGQTRTPDWVANLRAHSDVSIVVNRRSIDIRATELEGDERDVAWARLREPFPQIDGYAELVQRVVPVFRFDPRQPS